MKSPDFAALEQEALRVLADTADLAVLEAWRLEYLGRRGRVTLALRALRDLPKAERPAAGQVANRLKRRLETALEARRDELQGTTGAATARAAIDVTLPARPQARGHLHPITRTLRDIEQAFGSMGFEVIEGPEVEWDRYNFERLRIPADHPARDMWDTIWIDGPASMLLRTHTSPMQIRFMEQHRPPIRAIFPGTCYRYEATDATHEWMVTMVEALAVDEGVTFSDLKGTLETFVHRLFGLDVEARFRCAYFPFVEPGLEVDIRWRDGRWIELLGAGMVHPEILADAGYDPERYTGFAVGIGVERTAMLRHGIDDIRHFYQNDLRFLEQF